ncbi:hypothetical protein [Janibacter terrae]|uniref:hypothetical protein n=1 Tax=Janibacter terrae TaxID=103817 RepID=UPI0031F8829D
MSKPRRASLGGRNSAAIAHSASTSTPEVPEPAPMPEPVQESVQESAAEPQKNSTAPPVTSAGGDTIVRHAIYFPSDLFGQAKGAYLADWQAGGQADTFAAWIGAALDAHAARTAGQRAQLARPVVRADTRTGASRSFNLSAATIERVHQAITQDQAADRWPSVSAWCRDAIAAAVERARDRCGGTLPTPPARLPNRLRR